MDSLIYGILGCKEGELNPNKAGLLVPKTVIENTILSSIKVNNLLLHSEAFGNPNNPLLLMLHGGPGGDYRYLLNCKKFVNDGFYVVFYDQRGSGLFQRLSKESNKINQMEEEVGNVINYFRKSPNQKVFILGHSWGGILATYPNVQLELTKDTGHDMIDDVRGWQNFYPVAKAYLNSLK